MPFDYKWRKIVFVITNYAICYESENISATYRLDGIGMASGNINESVARGLCGHYYHHLK